MRQATTGEVRPDEERKAARFSASAQSTGGFNAGMDAFKKQNHQRIYPWREPPELGRKVNLPI
jgi:hypothetical protein